MLSLLFTYSWFAWDRAISIQPRLSWRFLDRPSWPWTLRDPPASAWRVLGLRVCTTCLACCSGQWGSSSSFHRMPLPDARGRWPYSPESGGTQLLSRDWPRAKTMRWQRGWGNWWQESPKDRCEGHPKKWVMPPARGKCPLQHIVPVAKPTPRTG